MDFRLYVELAKYFWKQGDVVRTHILRRASHPLQSCTHSPQVNLLFLLLCWNTLVRNQNCADVVLTNIGWAGDAMTIVIKATKTNPDGRNRVQEDPKHIYANITMPCICPVLAMGVYLLLNPSVLMQSTNLFLASSTGTFYPCLKPPS
jgi:hypothetical protein